MDEYISIKLPVKFYGEKIDEFLKNNPQFRSRADACREIIRQFMERENQE